MIYLSLVLALVAGYVIGLLQEGINISVNNNDAEVPEKYNESIGIDEYMKYYEETDGANKF